MLWVGRRSGELCEGRVVCVVIACHNNVGVAFCNNMLRMISD